MTFADWIFFNSKEDNKKFFLEDIKFIHIIGMVGVLIFGYLVIAFWEDIKFNLSIADGFGLQVFVVLFIPLIIHKYLKKLREIKT